MGKQERKRPKARARREANAKAGQRGVPYDTEKPRAAGVDEAIAERRAKAVTLRKAGATYRRIAQECHCDLATAWSDVQAALSDTLQLSKDAAEEVKALELERLDDWTVGLNVQMRKGDAAAVNALVRISTRRAKLLGLDAPIDVRHQIDVSRLSPEELDTFIALMQKVTGGMIADQRE